MITFGLLTLLGQFDFGFDKTYCFIKGIFVRWSSSGFLLAKPDGFDYPSMNDTML